MSKSNKATYKGTFKNPIRNMERDRVFFADPEVKGSELEEARKEEEEMNKREGTGYWMCTYISKLTMLAWFAVLSLSMTSCEAQQIIKMETIYILEGDPTAVAPQPKDIHHNLAVVTDSYQITVVWHKECKGYILTIYHFASDTEVTEYPCLDKARVCEIIKQYITPTS